MRLMLKKSKDKISAIQRRFQFVFMTTKFPQLENRQLIRPAFIWIFLLLMADANSQPITGLWKGKIKSTNLELKLIKKGDSLVGTSYYYRSADSYRRYSVRGYLDAMTNDVVWWDEQLLEEKANGISVGKEAMMMVADFNCPDPGGNAPMTLEGEARLRDESKGPSMPLDLTKRGSSLFPDEWDYVLANYTRGANRPEFIDSISLVATGISVVPPGYEEAPLAVKIKNPTESPYGARTELLPVTEAKPGAKTPELPQLTLLEKFSSRSKMLQTVIPVKGDSIELRFYDNAEIDGDSIAVFLNGQMLEQHILLSDQPHILKIATSELSADNEMVMVAENLGSIPPNTSLMVAIVGENRYEARLQSSEGSSALVRFVKINGSSAKKTK